MKNRIVLNNILRLKQPAIKSFALALGMIIIVFSILAMVNDKDEDRFLFHIVDPLEGELKMYLKDEDHKFYSNFDKLKKDLKDRNEDLIFAMNGGMYMEDQRPLGLYIENGKQIRPLNEVQEAFGNFYLQPNGVFYIDHNLKAGICKSVDFRSNNISYATQSGPMLLIDGQFHSKINKGSSNVHIRNGVGLLENGKLLFAMSKERVNFYDFAEFFKNKGCKNALYLDGFVSRTFLPEKDWIQSDGRFGVIIAQSRKLN